MVAIYSGVTKTENKFEISRFFHAIHNGHHVSRTCMTRIVSSLSLMTNVCTRERQRARETMRLGLQCLANRLFESYRFQRIASLSIARSERHNGRQKRAGNARNNGNTKTDYICTHRRKGYLFTTIRNVPPYDFAILVCLSNVHLVCAL